VARTVGTLLGKAQRYVNDVKAEVNRSMELDELKKMKETVESAARDVESSVHGVTADFEKQWQEGHCRGPGGCVARSRPPSPNTSTRRRSGA
jgi:sec-independent protein translocase protein TatB